jgi:hypothetical protein
MGRVTMPVFHGQGHDARTQADAPRARRHMGQENEGRRQAALVFVEVVLRHPGGVEAESLGMGDLLGHEPVAFARRHIVKQPAEEPEAFGGRGL